MHHLGGDADGQTPLDPDEAAQILRPAITTRGELDIVEQESIAQAIRWAFGRRRNPQTVLEERFLRRLHKRIFGDVWRWAGTYRQTARNIGVEHWMIQEEIGRLLGDSRFWVENATYEPSELCVRFHHRLVAIHPYPNGNGRHSRLAADILSVSLGGAPFAWGRGLGLDAAAVRARYIATLRAADAGELVDLLAFARS
jgi:Fic-DOC domain mobile mystery protein B